MDNINNNIQRFNGQYLKCIVSNYTSTKNYLGNSGSLIVIQPKNGKLNDTEWENDYKNGNIHKNYVYLGNEFLASGFGFGSQYILEKAEEIVKKYDDDIAALKEADRLLDNKIDTKIQEVYNELNKYVKTNGGHIENTVVNINGYDITTKDVILYGEEAKYKNLEINNVDISINGNKLNDSTVLMPIGSILKNINVDIEISKNDSGGISNLEVLHHLDEDENIYEGTKIKYDLDTEITIDEDYSIYKIFYSKRLDDTYVIDSYKNEVLKSIYVYVKATPVTAYKFYPGILRKFGVKIISSGNAITENIINLNKKVNIRPQYYVKYSDNGILDDIYFDKYKPLNSFEDYDRTTIIFDINRNSNLNGMIYVAVPSNFSVSKIFVLNNHCEKYNWTGAVGIIRRRKMKCVYTDESNPYYINYDIYCLKATKGFHENSSIELEIIYNYTKDNETIDGEYNNIPTQNVNNSDKILNTINNDTINDEEFNNLYWINYSSSPLDKNVNKLADKLNNVQMNCSYKEL